MGAHLKTHTEEKREEVDMKPWGGERDRPKNPWAKPPLGREKVASTKSFVGIQRGISLEV